MRGQCEIIAFENWKIRADKKGLVQNELEPFHKIKQACLYKNKKYSLDHVHYLFAPIEPQVMIGNCHSLERDGFGILEERIRSPNLLYH